MKPIMKFKTRSMGPPICMILMCVSLIGYSQVPLIKCPNPSYPCSSSSLIENSAKIGLGTSTPSAKFHVYSDISSGIPLKIETVRTLNGVANFYGSLESYVEKNGQMYGLYQTNASGLDILNYFKSDLKVGRVKIWNDYGTSTSGIALDSTTFDFSLSAGTGPVVHPLSINIHGIRVTSKAVMDEFQLLTEPGQNKVLVSDSAGNGYWEFPEDLSSEDDDWYFNKDRNLYANAQMVGVGVTNPLQRFHCNAVCWCLIRPAS